MAVCVIHDGSFPASGLRDWALSWQKVKRRNAKKSLGIAVKI